MLLSSSQFLYAHLLVKFPNPIFTNHCFDSSHLPSHVSLIPLELHGNNSSLGEKNISIETQKTSMPSKDGEDN